MFKSMLFSTMALTGRLVLMRVGCRYLCSSALQTIKIFKPGQNLRLLENLGRTKISQEQFCQIIGRFRLYTALPASQLRELPKVILG